MLPLWTLGLAVYLMHTDSGLAQEKEWPSPVTWKPDERAMASGLYIEPRAPARRARVEFTVTEPSGVKRERWPVRGSLPMYRGELPNPKCIRLLDPAGKEIPVQGFCTGFWPEKSVRFLCLDFLADLEPGQEKKFSLEYGAEVRPSAPATLKLSGQGNQSAEIGTGAATFRFKTGPDFLQVALANPGKSCGPITGRVLVAKDEKGTSPATLPLHIDAITVVEQGPVQATVHLQGHYGEAKANPPANDPNAWRFPCSLYVRVYAGSGHAYLEHTFGYNGDEYADFITSYGLKIPAGLKTGKFLFGPDEAGSKETGLGMRLNQFAHNQWKLSGKQEEAGKRIGGWAALKGDGVQVVAAIREAWQNWPVAFTAEESGDLLVEILGEAPGRALDLRHQVKGGNNAIHKSHSFYGGETLDDDYETPFRDGRPAGITKIHELLLDFSAGATPAAQIGRGHQIPLVPYAGTQRFEDTRALGHLGVYGDPKHDYLKEFFSVMLDAYPVIHEANGLYGWVDWGDLPMCNPPKGGKFPLILAGGVGWSNGERALAPYFYHYAAGGGRRFLDLGRAMVHHTLGIDVEHRGGDAGGRASPIGAYHRHTQVHWRSEGGTRQGGYRGWHAYYWLTGDPEVGQQALEYGIDAPANRRVMDITAQQPLPSVSQDYQASAPHSLAHWCWITSGDWRYARAHHAISRLWVICGEQGKAPKNGWVFFQVKDNEPVGYTVGDPGPMGGYWHTYGEDDLLLDWISLTGDPAAVEVILQQGKLHKGDTALYHSPEAFYVALAALQPTHPELKGWLEKRLWMHADLKSFQNKKSKTTGVYKSAEEWSGYGVYLYGKNGFSIHGAEGLEILLLMKAQEILEQGKQALKAAAPPPELAAPRPAVEKKQAAAEQPAPVVMEKVTAAMLEPWKAKLRALVADGLKAGQTPVAFMKILGREERVKVIGADDKAVQIEMRGNGMPMGWSGLTLFDEINLARAFLRNGTFEDHLLVAILALGGEQNDLAAEHFAKAQAADAKEGAARVAEARASLSAAPRKPDSSSEPRP